jgi:glycosyltransferase involved in cell wall biosynthesis
VNAKTKIIIVGPGAPYRNGPAIYLTYLCNSLVKDFDVELINYTLLYPSFLFPGKTQYDESKSILAFDNVRMVNSINPLSWTKTAAYINKQNPDMVVFDWWHPFFGPCQAGIAAFLNKSLKKKVVYITENVISHEANKVDKTLTQLALRNANAFLALSESVKKHLGTMFSTTVFRSELPIYNFYTQTSAADNTKASFGFKPDDIVFLFFGLVRKYKGLDLLLEAFARIAKNRADVKLLVVGEFYVEEKQFTDIVNENSIADKVIIENRFVQNEEVERYFRACDAVVLPYRSATQSGVLNVGYNFLKPAIVTNVGELGSLVANDVTGVVVDTPSVDSIEQGMNHFLSLKSNGVQFDKNIKQYVEDNNEFKNVNKVFAEMVRFVNP